MSISVKECNIKCVWGGTLTGVLLRNDAGARGKVEQTTVKIIGIHGWLDNLNSMLPLAKILVERHPSEICFIIEQWLYFLVVDVDYEIYLYDRAGHGFSSHLPKGVDCSDYHNHQDLRNIIQSTSFIFSQS
jgi:pimeloyl-ACP methyl ester carboxylesterase